MSDRQRATRGSRFFAISAILIPFHAIEPLIARSYAWNAIAPRLFGFG